MRLFYEIVSRLLLLEQQIAASGAREGELKPERVGPDTEGGDESQSDHIHASNSISMGCSLSELEAKEQAGGADGSAHESHSRESSTPSRRGRSATKFSFRYFCSKSLDPKGSIWLTR